MTQSDRIDEATADLSAPPDKIFATFCDPQQVERWMPPPGMRAEVDRWSVGTGEPYAMALVYVGEDHPTGKAGGGRDEVRGRFVTVEPPRRIIQQAEFPSDDPANAGIMTLEWRFDAQGTGTKAHVRATSVPASIDPADHRKALAGTLRQLGEAAARG